MLKHNNCHFPNSYSSITMETSTQPGSLSSDTSISKTGKWVRHEIQPPSSTLREMGDVSVLVLVAGIMGSTSFAFQTKPFKKQNNKQLTTQLISIYGLLQKSNFPLIRGRRLTIVCKLIPVPWVAVVFPAQSSIRLKTLCFPCRVDV